MMMGKLHVLYKASCRIVISWEVAMGQTHSTGGKQEMYGISVRKSAGERPMSTPERK
jgi:hypothetical protein